MADIEPRYHYDKQWVRTISGQGGMTFGRHVFFAYSTHLLTDRLMKHEKQHVQQYARFRIFKWWWTSIPIFLTVYVFQWIMVGFRYSKIPLEIEARAAERVD